MIHLPLITMAGHTPGKRFAGACIAAALGLLCTTATAPAQEAKPATGKKDPVEAPAVPAVPRSEATALKEFKSEMGVLKTWVLAQQKAAKQNPMAGLKLIQEMATKIAKVRTDGLPADLGSEFKNFTGLIKQMAAVFHGMPEDESEMLTWLNKKGADPEFRTKMELIGKELSQSGEKLKEVGKKYGLESELDLDGKEADSKAGAEEDPVVEEK